MSAVARRVTAKSAVIAVIWTALLIMALALVFSIILARSAAAATPQQASDQPDIRGYTGPDYAGFLVVLPDAQPVEVKVMLADSETTWTSTAKDDNAVRAHALMIDKMPSKSAFDVEISANGKPLGKMRLTTPPAYTEKSAYAEAAYPSVYPDADAATKTALGNIALYDLEEKAMQDLGAVMERLDAIEKGRLPLLFQRDMLTKRIMDLKAAQGGVVPTPSPTPTPVPTATPKPTPVPTVTPKPTATPKPAEVPGGLTPP